MPFYRLPIYSHQIKCMNGVKALGLAEYTILYRYSYNNIAVCILLYIELFACGLLSEKRCGCGGWRAISATTWIFLWGYLQEETVRRLPLMTHP